MYFLKVQILLPYEIDVILNQSCDIFIIPSFTTHLSPRWLALPQVISDAMHIFLISPVFKDHILIKCPNGNVSPHATWL